MARRHGGHEVIHADDPAVALAAAPEVEVALGTLTPELFLAARNLKWAHSFSAGLDKLLTAEVSGAAVHPHQHGRQVRGAGRRARLGAAAGPEPRRGARGRRPRRWQRGAVTSLTGGTLLIIGLGGFGMHTLQRAAGYEMTVLALDPVKSAGPAPDGVAELLAPTPENLHAFLARADAVAVTCPLLPETYHLIGAEELAQMQPTAYLVNVSRGGIIDEPALMAALHAGTIAGAGLDVCEVEPVPDDSPLWSTPNLVVTPHRAGFSQRRPAETHAFALEQLERYLTGQPLQNITDKRAGF